MIEPKRIYDINETSLQRLLDIRLIQLLLAGLYYVFGPALSRTEKEKYRDEAYRVRRAISDVNLFKDTHINNKSVLRAWSRDDRPHWRQVMRWLWNWPPVRLNCWVSRLARPFSDTLKIKSAMFGKPRVKAPP